jgi:hypothetical protein
MEVRILLRKDVSQKIKEEKMSRTGGKESGTLISV